MAGLLEGKTALITGSGSGIGLAVARLFRAQGAHVVGLDRVAPDDDEAAPGAAVTLVGDVRSSADNRRAVDMALQRHGRLDVFVGNAGRYDNRRPFRSFSSDELESAYRELFDVDVLGYLLGAHAAAEALARSRGCIVFTGSVSGAHAGFGGALYVAAKHAVHGLTRQLALELAPDVRVNAVAPGYVPTGLQGLESLQQGASPGRPSPAQMPLQSIASADDIAAAYLFLASDACARTATGTVLTLDGGSGLRGPRA